MAEGRRELSPREDRVRRQEAGRLVLARLHGEFISLRHDGQLIAIQAHIRQLFLFPKTNPAVCLLGREKRAK